MKWFFSLVMFFAGGYGGWLINSQLDELNERLRSLDKVLSEGDISPERRGQVVESAISNMQKFVTGQIDYIFHLLSFLVAAWVFLLVCDVVRGRINHDLMNSFENFDILRRHVNFRMAGLLDHRIPDCTRRALLRVYGWYQKTALEVAEGGIGWLVICLVVFFLFSVYMLQISMNGLHALVNDWISGQMKLLSI